MTQRAISRRDFLHLATVTSAGALIAACAPPGAQTGSGEDGGAAMEEVTIEFWVNQPHGPLRRPLGHADGRV